MDLFKDKIEVLDKEARKLGFMVKAGEMTGRKPGEIALAIIGIVLLFIVIGFGSTILTTVVAILYPSYRSFRAIESKEDNDDKQWLTYWVVFSIFHFVDEFLGFILQEIPFYFLLRVCFFVWMFLPNTQGAMVIYDKVLAPLIEKYGDKITQVVEKATDVVGNIASEATDAAKAAAAKAASPENLMKAASAAAELQS